MPVFASVRPRGRTLRVHAGKALRTEEAAVGALMEAVEFAVAEAASETGPDMMLSLRQWEQRLPGSWGLIDLAPRLNSKHPRNRPLATVLCEDLASGRDVLLPADLVLLPQSQSQSSPLFSWSSNGLASGNSLDEATLHALLEILERDTLALNRAGDESLLLANDDLPPPLDRFANAWRESGVELFVRYLPNFAGLACFEATLHEAASTDVNLAAGSGLHPDRGIALARAVCEAAQSRLTTIHGGRDDITGFYSKYTRADAKQLARLEDRIVAAAKDGSRRISYHDVPHVDVLSPTVMLRELQAHLALSGFDCICRCQLAPRVPGIDMGDLHVVKLVVPRSESAHEQLHIGPRLMDRMLRHG